MKKILILRGIPASGKSTYAKQLVKDNPGMYKRINRDELRHMLDGYHLTKSNEKFVKRVRDFLIKEALHDGKHVIVDDTNISETNLVRVEQLAKTYENETGQQVKVETKLFEIGLDEAVERDAKREKPVGKAVIKKIHQQLHGVKKLIPEYRDQDNNLPKAIICDLDGTLALMKNRGPYEGAKCESDLPNPPVVNLVKTYQKLGHKILLLSGRSEQFKPETENWLKTYDISYDGLWMRRAKDNRKDAIVKRELFETHIESDYCIEFVLDDRDQVVDLWRLELKLPCLQVFYGDF